MLDLERTDNVNNLLSSGFKRNPTTFTKQLGDLSISVNETTIVINDTVSLETKILVSNKSTLSEVLVMRSPMEVSEPLDLSIPSEEDNPVSSEVKNRALAKMNDEFMSQPFTIDDCNILKFLSFDDGVGLSWGSLTFMFRQLDIRLFVLHQGLSIKSLENPTRKQVDEVYHFFTGEHLDFSPKQKVYNWENCFNWDGWFMNEGGRILKSHNKAISYYNQNVYPTKEDAEAALAHCQLLHIVNKINEDYPRIENKGYQVFINDKADFDITNLDTCDIYEGLILNSKEGAEMLIRDNEQLLKTYFKIK